MLPLLPPWLAQATRGPILNRYIRLYLLYGIEASPKHATIPPCPTLSHISRLILLRCDSPGVWVRLRRSTYHGLRIHFDFNNFKEHIDLGFFGPAGCPLVASWTLLRKI